MNPETWRHVERLYHEAGALPEAERAAFLRNACGGDDALVQEVESLLRQAASGSGPLDEPLAPLAVQLLGGDASAIAGVKRGQRLGAFVLGELIGVGGMGEVYRAHDIRLGREVAIKLLPPAFAAEAERHARFTREARLLAALNHPNIAAIHGLEEADGLRGLVLELVDGDTLAERLAARAAAGGPGLPLADALTIARQVADALDAAHEKGIVHRDLKPANIKLTPDGVVKLLDFGLAKVMAPLATDEPAHRAAPASGDRTRAGAVLGTVAYMSPEQARGLAVDKRTDIWAFGCVLYEMLSGRPAFAGQTASDVLAAVLERDVEWAALPTATPAHLRRLMARCLQKDPRRRVRDIGDVRLEIEDSVDPGEPPHHGRQPRPRRLVTAAVGVGLVALGAVLATLAWRPTPAADPIAHTGPIRFDIASPDQQLLGGLAVSPDGQSIAYAARDRTTGRRSLWVRPLSSTAARELPGTEDAQFPFWSPDGRSLGFFADDVLMRLDLAGGAPQTIVRTVAAPLGADWGPSGTIIYSARSVIYKVPAIGGPSEAVATIDRNYLEDSLRAPRFLPGGRRFLYVSRSARIENHAVSVGSLDGTPPVRLFQSTSHAEYSPSGHLLFVRNQTLVARRFDPDTLELGADIIPVVGGLGTGPGLVSPFALSPAGVLVYRRANTAGSVLRRFDRSGHTQGPDTAEASYGVFRIRPDGRVIAVSFDDDGDGQSSLWTLDAADQTLTRLTLTGALDRDPVWAPDGQRIAFASTRGGSYGLYVKSASGSGPEETLLATDDDMWPDDWSSDGRFLAVRRARPTSSIDIVVVPLEGDRTPIAVAESPSTEYAARFSPDGRWIAYVSNETGRDEVYVQPFPPSGGRRQVSLEGGAEPNWRGDGRELLYVRPDGTITATPVSSDGGALSFGRTHDLFQGTPPQFPLNRYDVTRDGESFVVSVPVPRPPSPISVIVNWMDLLDAPTDGAP